MSFPSSLFNAPPTSEEKAMYSAELERHKREKEEWKRKAERVEDQASALQVNRGDLTSVIRSGPFRPPSSL